MASQIKSSPTKTFLELMTSINYCSIPAFQRSYNWTNKQISGLWEGLVENEDHYYIGNLVVIDRTDKNAEPYFEIIDGQQRITTLCLILIALRNFVEKDKSKKILFPKLNHDDVVKDINTVLFKTSSFEEGKVTLKLRFHKDNLNDVYKELVLGTNGHHLDVENLDDNQKRFVRNTATISSFIKEYFKNSESKLIALKSILEKLKQLQFILIVCESDSNAYRLFEGLNSTGLELSVVDLVKNSVFLSVNSLNPKQLPKVENTWQEIENIFEDYEIKRLPKFLRHQWIATEGYINTSALYDKIKEQKLSGSCSSIISYVESLRNDAKSYVGLKTANESYLDKKIKIKHSRILERIKRFSWLDAEQVYAVILAYYNKYLTSDKYYTPKIFCNDLDRLWNFSFLISFMDISPSLYEKKFADRCRNISKYTGKKYSVESDRFYKGLAEMVQGKESEFSKMFSADFVSSNNNKELVRYVLQEYLWHEENKNVQSVRKDEPTIEHILPQKPDKWGLTEIEVEPYVHKIGNLTLLGDSENGSIGEQAFGFKYKELYSKDLYPKNRYLNKYTTKFEKTPDEAIDERGKDMGKVAYKMFSVF